MILMIFDLINSLQRRIVLAFFFFFLFLLFDDFSHGHGLDTTKLGLSWSGTRHVALHHPELTGLTFCIEHTGLRGYQAAS